MRKARNVVSVKAISVDAPLVLIDSFGAASSRWRESLDFQSREYRIRWESSERERERESVDPSIGNGQVVHFYDVVSSR